MQKQNVMSLLGVIQDDLLAQGPGKYNPDPYVFNDISRRPEFNSQIDGLIAAGTQLNVHKRPLPLQNSLFAPIIFNKSKVFGFLQIANVNTGSYFSENDGNLVMMLARYLAQYLNNIKQQWFEKLEVQRRLDATLLSSQIENTNQNHILLLSNRLFAEKKNPLRALRTFVESTEDYLCSKFECLDAQILLIDKQRKQFLQFNQEQRCQLIPRGETFEKSVANFVLANDCLYCFPPLTYANLNSSMLSKATGSAAGQS